MNCEQLARLRQGLYRFIGAAFESPSQGLVDTSSGVLEVFDDLGLFDYAFATDVAHATHELASSNMGDLRVAYVALFESGPGGAPCPLNESAHLGNPRTGDVALIQSAVRQVYARYAINVDITNPDQIDHVATELAAMSHLCSREHVQRLSLQPYAATIRAQSELMADHVLRWMPSFAQTVEVADLHPAYTALAGALRSVLEHERQLIPLLAADELVAS